uniref:FGENESH: predicted gene_18.1 protein n=1 Tax=Rhodotorula toruloides TaxID=5286 RepID=A0A0K3CPD4_RHOTO
MAIAPITGMLRKHLLTNLSIGIGGGVVGTASHLPNVRNRDAWYLAYQENKAKAESE